MDIAGNIGFVAKAALCRKIQFVRYAKPHVVEYPTNAIVLNPHHTARAREALASTVDGHEKTATTKGTALSHRERRPKGADDDDPRYQPDDELICNDSRFYEQVLQLGWQDTLRHGGVGAGLVNQGNTCFLNSVLQAIAHTPPIAQFLIANFKAPSNAAPGAPIDFAYYLADVTRRLLGIAGGQNDPSGRGGGSARVVKPSGIVGNLRGISKSLKVGQQADAHEFYVYLIQAVQTSLLFRYNGGKKVPLKVSASTPLLRVLGGYLRSQVAWSRNDELTMLRRAHQNQAAADLEMGRATHPSDRLFSNTYDPFTIMSLAIAGHTLEHCLDEFCRVEPLDGRCYQSPRKVGVKATKCFRIHIPPPVLCIQLKRFDAMRAKVSKKIVYPAVLDVVKWCSEGLKEYGGVEANTVYDLCAVVVHEGGSLSYGHYIAIVKLRNNLWAVCNDESVRVVAEDVALRQQAYMLFYAKRPVPVVVAPKRSSGDTAAVAPRPVAAPLAAMEEGRQLTDGEVQAALAERRARQEKKHQPSPQRDLPTAAQKPHDPSHTPAVQTKGAARRRYVDDDSDDDDEARSSVLRVASKHKNAAPLAVGTRNKSASPPMRPSSSPRHPACDGTVGSPLLKPSTTAAAPHGMYDGIKASLRQASSSPRLLPSSTAAMEEALRLAPEPTAPVAETVGVAQLMGADVIKALRQSKDQSKHTTIQRPRHAEKMRTRSRDEQWDAVMDAGRVKKVRRRENADEGDANVERPNRFQANGLSFDLRGRRVRGDKETHT